MKSFIMQPGYEESMKKVGQMDYPEILKGLKKLDNGMSLLTEEQKRKYGLIKNKENK